MAHSSSRAAVINNGYADHHDAQTTYWDMGNQDEWRRPHRVQSVLFIVNQTSRQSRTFEELQQLHNGFHYYFGSISRRVFAVTSRHDQVIDQTQQFLTSSPGPWLLLSGGGDGTNRAIVQGLMAKIKQGTVQQDNVQISALHLGSGNLLPRQFGIPLDPLTAMGHIANNLFTERSVPCCVYECIFHYPNGAVQTVYGVTMASIGQLGRVPNNIQQWRDKHPHFMQWATRRMALEDISAWQYIAFTLIRAIKCLVQPRRAELVEIRHNAHHERGRLFSGILVNFDFPQLPFRSGYSVNESRILLALIPLAGRWQTLSTLLRWRHLDDYVRKYEIVPEQPLELHFLENDHTVLALDEDVFVAPSRLSFGVATLINFVADIAPGTANT
jgi:hypothetical protein